MTTATTENLFTSLPALRAQHRELQKEYRSQGNTPAMLERIEDFIVRGRMIGTILDDEEDQAAVQSLLDLWGSTLYRAGRPVPETCLLPFDKNAAPTLDDQLVPYVGPDAFEESKQHIFFGREDMVASLIERIRNRNLLAISGPSGSGKSSLVLAGIIPALKNEALPGSAGWRYLGRMVPGSSPFENLSRLLLHGQETGSGSAQSLADRLRGKPESLCETVSAGDEPTAVLVIDQFEELSTLCEDSAVREAFERAMVNFVGEGRVRNILVLTMRSDFIGAVARLPEFQKLLETALVPITPLSASELREAITRPAEGIGLKFEPGIVDSLVHDTLGEPAALPLLQFTLLKLWERRDHNRITPEAYRALGGGRLALTRSADEFIHGLIPEERIMAERILLRLVRPGIGQDNVANRIRKVSLYTIGPRENVDRVLNKLIAQHFVRLTVGDTEEDTEVEIAHEALIRNWQHLVSLLETERQHMTTLRRLEIKAAEWVRLGRGTSVVLRDAALAEAEQWLANPDFAALGASNDLRQLVKTSQNVARAARRRSSIVRVVSVLTIAFAVFAAGAIRYAVEARKETERAEEQTRLAKYNSQEANEQREKAEALNAELQAANGKLKAAQAKSAAEERLHDTDMLGDNAESVIAQDPEQSSLLALEAVGTLLDHHQQVSTDLISILARATQANRVRVIVPMSSEVMSLAFSPDALTLAVASRNEPVRIWDAVTGKAVSALEGTLNTTAIAFSYSGQQIAVATSNGVQTFVASDDPQGRKYTAQGKPYLTNGAIRRLVFSPNDQYVAAFTSTGNVEYWSPKAPSRPTVLQGISNVTAMAFNPTGQVLVTGSEDGLVKTWDMETGELMQVLNPDKGNSAATAGLAVGDLAFNPDATLEVSRKNGTYQRLTLIAGEPFVITDGSSLVKSRITFATNASTKMDVFSLDGNRFAAVSRGISIKIWDVGNAEAPNAGKLSFVNDQVGTGLFDAIDRAAASLTDQFQSPRDCQMDICNDFLPALSAIVEGNRLAKLGDTNEALAKFEFAQHKAPWLSHHGGAQQWAQKQIQWLQEQTKADLAGQQYRGQLAQTQRKQQNLLAASNLFRSAAYSAAKQMDEQRVVQWLTRAREILPAGAAAKDSPEIEAQQLILNIRLKQKDLTTLLAYIANARESQPQLSTDNDSYFNNELCWMGSISDGAFFKDPEIVAACDRAVLLSHDYPAYRDSRGVNLARNGDYQRAIEDFSPYANDPKTPQDRKSAREGWIAALKQGQDPFTPDVLKQMMQRGW